MISIEQSTDDALIIEARGRLDQHDYERIVPRLEREIERKGKLRVLIRLEDFDGWTPKALVDELSFDVRHRDDFDRVAIVGESRWQELGTKMSKPFFSGSMRYFEDEAEARRWLA